MFHRPRLFDKRAVVVTTTAGAGESAVAKYLKSVLGHWGISGALTLACKAQTTVFTPSAKQATQIARIAYKFHADLARGKKSPPSLESLVVHSAFRGMCTVANPLSRCDADYWRESGLAVSVYPRGIGPVKTALGAIICGIMRAYFRKADFHE
jgi:hypothetical protein